MYVITFEVHKKDKYKQTFLDTITIYNNGGFCSSYVVIFVLSYEQRNYVMVCLHFQFRDN